MDERTDARAGPDRAHRARKERSSDNGSVTEILLVRHATADHVGRFLAGRTPGIHLGDEGRRQARALADMLGREPLAAVLTSPLERCRETAEALAEPHGVKPVVDEAFTEVDFGDWTGIEFTAMEGRDDWRWWNEARGTARVPGGESMVQVLDRALLGVRRAAEAHGGARLAIVTHKDVIRPLIAHFLGFPLDNILRIDVEPASVTVAEWNPWGVSLRRIGAVPPGVEQRP